MEREPEEPEESEGEQKEGISVRVGQRTIRLAWSEVAWVEIAADRLLRITTTTGEHHLLPGALKDLDVAASQHGLMRINKAITVAISQIKQLRRRSNGYFAYLAYGAGTAELPVSRRKAPELKRLLKARGVLETRWDFIATER